MDGKSLVVGRKRANTSEIILDSEMSKTKDLLEKMVKQRKISPQSREVVEKVLRDCNLALKKKITPGEVSKLKESLIWGRDWVEKKIVQDEKFAEDRKELQILKMKAFALKYGDYLAQCCADFRKMVDDLPSKALFRGRYWAEVWEDLLAEEKAMKEWEDEDSGGLPPQQPITDALRECSKQCILDFEGVRRTVEEYVKRNEFAHESKLDELVMKRGWPDIALSIAKDLEELPHKIPTEMKDREKVLAAMTGAVEMFRDKHFKFIDWKDVKYGKVIDIKWHLQKETQDEDERLIQKKKEQEATK
jgi:hypothetical protein